MSTTLSRKAWRDVGRRRARAVLTAATIALAATGFGLLAVPSLIDRTMSDEVSRTHLYDITLSVRDLSFGDAQARELTAIPNVKTVSARVTYSTRALVGQRRIPVTIWGVADFTHQPIDAVRVTDGSAPAGGQVLADDGNGRSVDVSLGAGERVRLVTADGTVAAPEVTGSGRSLAFWQGPWTYPKQLILFATNDTVRGLSGIRGVNNIALRLDDTSPEAVDATVIRLQTWLTDTAGPGALTDMPLTRNKGDWPGRVFAHQMTTFVYVMACLALVTAVFLIANTMNTLMAEQTAEIGVMKAIGGRRRQIAGVYLRAALYLAGFGVLLGVPLGALLASTIAGFVTSSVLGVPGKAAVSVPVMVFGAVFAVALTVAATVPALRRALRIPVREALQSQGAGNTFGISRLDRLLMHGRALPRTLRFGTRNLVRNKRRAAATTLQVALAVATALGFMNMAISFNRSLNADFAVIGWDASMYAPPGAPRLDANARQVAATTAGVDRVEPVLQNTVEFAGESFPILGTSGTGLYHPDLRAGSWYGAHDVEQGAAVAVIGPNLARENHLRAGDTVTVRTAGGNAELRVIGIDSSQQQSGRVFYVPLRWLQRATGWGDASNLLWLSTADASRSAVDRTTNAVEDALTASGYRVAPEKLYALKAQNKAANDSVINMIVVVGGVVVAIGIVGLVNAMTMSVIERTREIGILRCVGARARDIRRAFAAESVVQAALGWTIGLPLGWLLSWGLARLTLVIMELEIATVFDFVTALAVLATTVALAAAVVLIPVRRAARTSPGDALRYV